MLPRCQPRHFLFSQSESPTPPNSYSNTSRESSRLNGLAFRAFFCRQTPGRTRRATQGISRPPRRSHGRARPRPQISSRIFVARSVSATLLQLSVQFLNRIQVGKKDTHECKGIQDSKSRGAGEQSNLSSTAGGEVSASGCVQNWLRQDLFGQR